MNVNAQMHRDATLALLFVLVLAGLMGGGILALTAFMGPNGYAFGGHGIDWLCLACVFMALAALHSAVRRLR